MTTQKIRAIYKNGKLEPLEPLELSEEQEVTLLVEPPSQPVPSLQQIQQALRAALPELSEMYHIESLELFGSFVRGDARPDSDLDVLVTFRQTPTLFMLVQLQQELSTLLGLKVDLVLKDGLKPALRPGVLSEATPV
jgi:predicted nucleotidyltransferase